MRTAAATLALLLVAAPAWAGCRVALDIGHSRDRPGAVSASGKSEWSFNAALALRVEAALRTAGIDVVVLNRDGAALGLTQRPKKAAALGATLLLSLHHDSVQPRYLVNGVSDRFAGFGLFLSGENPRPEESALVAITLADRLLAAGFRPSLHHAEAIPGENRPLLDAGRGIYRYDGLAVLRHASMAALLFEAGVIVNPSEEKILSSDASRDRMAGAIVAAVRDHCTRVENSAAIR
jgi:N-acetylmuramoyl-L-alanine amidase